MTHELCYPPGRLEIADDGERLRCHLCGGAYANLGQHARLAHGIPAADYRALCGLNRTTPLIAPALRERYREQQGPRLRRLHAEGRIMTWRDDPEWFAAAKGAAVDVIREGMRPEGRANRRAAWDDARRARRAAERRARNLAGERATPEQIQAGLRRGTIICVDCGAEVPRRSPRHHRCDDCRALHERAYQREWKRRRRAND